MKRAFLSPCTVDETEDQRGSQSTQRHTATKRQRWEWSAELSRSCMGSITTLYSVEQVCCDLTTHFPVGEEWEAELLSPPHPEHAECSRCSVSTGTHCQRCSSWRHFRILGPGVTLGYSNLYSTLSSLPWANSLTSLCLSFLTCQMGII